MEEDFKMEVESNIESSNVVAESETDDPPSLQRLQKPPHNHPLDEVDPPPAGVGMVRFSSYTATRVSKGRPKAHAKTPVAKKSSKAPVARKSTRSKTTIATPSSRRSPRANVRANQPTAKSTSPKRKNPTYEGFPRKSLGGGHEWPKGWLERSFSRKSGHTAGREDSYWYAPAPSDREFRSLREVRRHLGLE